MNGPNRIEYACGPFSQETVSQKHSLILVHKLCCNVSKPLIWCPV